MMYELPTSVEVSGKTYEIRADFRAVLDIIAALNDQDLDQNDKALALLNIFYPGFHDMPVTDYQEAVEKCLWFINCGTEDNGPKQAKLMDWEQDFPLIAAPVNHVLGKEIRSPDVSIHWWTLLSAYQEIGDCLFAQVVNIRQKKAKGKKLDKQEQEFYKKNRHLVDFKRKYTEQDDAVLDAWLGKKKTAP